MAHAAFRADQHARLHEAHIAPITDLVDELSLIGRGFIPHVAGLDVGRTITWNAYPWYIN